MDPATGGIDLSQYSKLKKSKNVELVKVGKAFGMSTRRWDPNSGKEIDPELMKIRRQIVAAVVKDLETRLASVKELLADMDTLSPPDPADIVEEAGNG